MPYRIRSPFTGQRIGHRGAFLLALSVFEAIIGWSILETPPQQFETLKIFQIAPQWCYAWLWIGSATLCVVGAFLRNYNPIDVAAYMASFAVPLLWGSSYIAELFLRELTWGLVLRAVTLWWGYSALVLLASSWPDPEGE